MKEYTTKELLEAYSRTLIPRVSEILEAYEVNPKLTNLIKQTIYDARDMFLHRLAHNMVNFNNGGTNENYKASYSQKTYKPTGTSI